VFVLIASHEAIVQMDLGVIVEWMRNDANTTSTIVAGNPTMMTGLDGELFEILVGRRWSAELWGWGGMM